MVKINFGEVSKTLKNIMSMIVAGWNYPWLNLKLRQELQSRFA